MHHISYITIPSLTMDRSASTAVLEQTRSRVRETTGIERAHVVYGLDWEVGQTQTAASGASQGCVDHSSRMLTAPAWTPPESAGWRVLPKVGTQKNGAPTARYLIPYGSHSRASPWISHTCPQGCWLLAVPRTLQFFEPGKVGV